jgi:hypothetical protein
MKHNKRKEAAERRVLQRGPVPAGAVTEPAPPGAGDGAVNQVDTRGRRHMAKIKEAAMQAAERAKTTVSRASRKGQQVARRLGKKAVK